MKSFSKKLAKAAALRRWHPLAYSNDENSCRPSQSKDAPVIPTRKRGRPVKAASLPLGNIVNLPRNLRRNRPMQGSHSFWNGDSACEEDGSSGEENDSAEEEDDEYVPSESDVDDDDDGGEHVRDPFVVDPTQPFLGTVQSLQKLAVLFSEKCTCVSKGNWEITSNSTYGRGGTLVATYKCSGCQNTFEYDSDAGHELRKKVVAGCLCAGISQAKYRRLGNAIGLDFYQRRTFNKVAESLATPVDLLIREEMQKNREELKSRPDDSLGSSKRACVSADFAWQITRQAPSGTGTLREITGKSDSKPGLLLDREHVSHHSIRGKEPFKGTSKSMEGYSVTKMVENVTADGITIEKYVQDGDSSSRRKIQDIAPETSILNCAKHMSRNLRKNLEKVSNQRCFTPVERNDLSERYGEIRDWHSTPDCICPRRHSRLCGCLNDEGINLHIMATFFRLMDESGNNPTEFKNRMMKYINTHLNGDHSSCGWHAAYVCGCQEKCENEVASCPNRKSYGEAHPATITCTFHHAKIQLEVWKVVSRAEEFLVPELGGQVTSNIVESTNSRFIEFRSKSHPLKGTLYALLTDLALCDVVFGDSLHYRQVTVDDHYVEKIWRMMGWSIPRHQRYRLQNDINSRMRNSLWNRDYRTSKRKQQTKVKKMKRDRARASSSVSNGNTYGT